MQAVATGTVSHDTDTTPMNSNTPIQEAVQRAGTATRSAVHLAFAGLLLLSAGCANFTVTSTPPGATVIINGNATEWTTPASIPIRSSKLTRGSHTIAVAKDGYTTLTEPYTMNIVWHEVNVFSPLAWILNDVKMGSPDMMGPFLLVEGHIPNPSAFVEAISPPATIEIHRKSRLLGAANDGMRVMNVDICDITGKVIGSRTLRRGDTTTVDVSVSKIMVRTGIGPTGGNWVYLDAQPGTQIRLLLNDMPKRDRAMITVEDE